MSLIQALEKLVSGDFEPGEKIVTMQGIVFAILSKKPLRIRVTVGKTTKTYREPTPRRAPSRS